MASLDYQAALKAGKTPQEIKSFVDSHNASGQTLNVVNTAPPRPQSFLDKAAGASNKFLGALAGFTGMDKAGESLGRLGLQLGNQMGKATGTDMNKTFTVPKFSGKQLTGDVLTLAGTGLNLAAPGSGSLGKTVLANSGAAGLLGAGNDLTQGKSAGEAVTHGLEKGAIAGAVTGGVGLLGKLFGYLAPKVAKGTYRQSLGLPRELDTEPLLKAGVVGDRPTIEARAMAEVAKLGKAQKVASDVGVVNNLADIADDPTLQKTITNLRKVGYGSEADNVVRKILNTEDVMGQPTLIPKKLTTPQLDDIKDTLDNMVSDAARRGDASGATPQTQGAIVNSMRRLLRKNAPEYATLEAAKSPFLETAEAMGSQLRAKPSAGFSLGSIFQRGILTPALGSRMAQAGYKASTAATAGQNNLIIQSMKRLGRVGSIAALGKF